MNKKGLFIGKSHDNGGIPSEIKETGQAIEIEGEEYYICRESYNSTDTHSFENKTNKEVLDSIYTKYSCKLVQEVMNAGDFIVCKLVVNDKTKNNRNGTVKEILNQMQGEKSCKVEQANSVARQGGKVGKSSERKKLISKGKRLIDQMNSATDKVSSLQYESDSERAYGSMSKSSKLEERALLWQKKEGIYNTELMNLGALLSGEEREELISYYGFDDLFDDLSTTMEQGGSVEKRYAADADFYVYADSDKEAEKEARKILAEIDKKYDNRPALNHLSETPFGSTTSRKIFEGGGSVEVRPNYEDFDNVYDSVLALMKYYGVKLESNYYSKYKSEHMIGVWGSWDKLPISKEELWEHANEESVYEIKIRQKNYSPVFFVISKTVSGNWVINPKQTVGFTRLFGKGTLDFSSYSEYADFIESEVAKMNDEAFKSTTKTPKPKSTKKPSVTEYTQENVFSREIKKAFEVSLTQDELLLERGKLVELLDFFELPKDIEAIKEISNEINSISTKINENLVYENTLTGADEGSYLFTPSNLLNYYYTQTSQSPVNKKTVPCKLKTPNGAKSKLSVDTYWQVRTEAFKSWFGDWEMAYKNDDYNDCSLIIDKDTKEPRIMFHGVRKFHPEFQMANMGKGVKRPYGTFEPQSFPASYFADNLEYVKFYGGNAKDMPTPYKGYSGFYYNVFMNIRNPIMLDELGFKASAKDFKDYILVRYGLNVTIPSKILAAVNGDLNKKVKVWAYIREGSEMIEIFKDNGYDGIVQLGDVPRFDKKGESLIDSEYLSFYSTQIKSADVKNSHFLPIFDDIRFKKGGEVNVSESDSSESLSDILKKY